MSARMHLRILLPHGTFADWPDVLDMVVPTTVGALGLLPNRLDATAVVRPGLLTYRREGAPDQYAALDTGILVKAGFDVTLSVHAAVEGAALGDLRAAVREQYGRLDEAERAARTLATRLETDFSRRLVELTHER